MKQKVIQNKGISNQNMSINARDELKENLSNEKYVKTLNYSQYIRKQKELNDLIYKCEFEK